MDSLTGTKFQPSLQRLSKIMKASGVRQTASACISVLEDHYLKCFDLLYGVRTSGYISLSETSVDTSKFQQANRYGPVNAWAFQRLLRELALSKNLRFADLGCGLGRACILAAEYGFAKVTGVELASEFCAIARENIRKCRRSACRDVPIEIINDDVAKYSDTTTDDVFFMYRPFQWEFFGLVVAKLVKRATEQGKTITVIYSERMNVPQPFTLALAQNPSFEAIHQLKTLGQQFDVYRCAPP
ncbi:MAG TPA: class I SAM-dependent methyltransferase [Candidatus Cybelea sp.]|nr:class I SAM-dependent methyltransferase [Candidatus Cybelea sp.]